MILWLRAIGLGGCRTCGMATRKSFRSPGPFLVISRYTVYWTHGHNPLHTSCPPRPVGQLGAGRLHYRRVYICVAHGKQRRSSFTTSRYLSRDNIVSIIIILVVLLWRSKPGLRFLYSDSSRNSSRCSPLLRMTSPPRPRFCAEDLPKPCWSTLRRGQLSTFY